MGTSTDSATMRVARLHGLGDVRVEREPVPVAADGASLVRVTAVGATTSRATQPAHGDGLSQAPGATAVTRAVKPVAARSKRSEISVMSVQTVGVTTDHRHRRPPCLPSSPSPPT